MVKIDKHFIFKKGEFVSLYELFQKAIFFVDEGKFCDIIMADIKEYHCALAREIFWWEISGMFVKDVTVQNQVGLHARPATFFIQKANEFKSSIWVEKEERRVNAKSLLGVLSLGIMGGTDIRIIAGGADEEEAVTALVALVESGFAE